MTWLCEKLGLPDPGISLAPEASLVEQEAERYIEHVLEPWRLPLADVEEARFGATHKTRWGEDMSLESMLEHIFRGRDIPLKGYLLSRAYPSWNRSAVWLLAPLLARCIRRRIDRGRRDLHCRLLLFLVRFALGKGYRTWADILSMGNVPDVAEQVDLIAQDVVKRWQGRFHPWATGRRETLPWMHGGVRSSGTSAWSRIA